MITKESLNILKEYFKRNSLKIVYLPDIYSLFEIVSGCRAFGHSVKRFISRRLSVYESKPKKNYRKQREPACEHPLANSFRDKIHNGNRTE